MTHQQFCSPGDVVNHVFHPRQKRVAVRRMYLRGEAQTDVLKAGLAQQREKLLPNQRVAAEPRLQRGEFFPDGVEPRALRIKFIQGWSGD